MEKFNTVIVIRNGLCFGVWALNSSIAFDDKTKANINDLVKQKQSLLTSKFSILFKVEHSDIIMGCQNVNSIINSVLKSIADNY